MDVVLWAVTGVRRDREKGKDGCFLDDNMDGLGVWIYDIV